MIQDIQLWACPWKGDKIIQDSAASYLKLLYIVFNEDYGKNCKHGRDS